MRSKFLIASLVLGLLAAALPASKAEEALPLIIDLPPGYDLAAKTVLDIGGVQLGQPMDEAHGAMIGVIPDGVSTVSRTTLEASDGYRRLGFEIAEGEKVVSASGSNPEAVIAVQYTTPTSGVRVMGVHWWARYRGEGPSFAETFRSLERKYGRPSYVAESTTLRLFYVWFEGNLAAGITAEQVGAADAAKKSPGGPAWCISRHGLDAFGVNRTYSESPIEDTAPGCSVVLMVELQKSGMGDALFTVSEDLFDYRRFHDNRLATSGWLRGKLEAARPK